ncbi:MAG: peptidase MA family metallohydrolase [Chloroflexota bacterium]
MDRGVAFPDYGITVIGVAPGQEDWAARIIPHELSHLVVGMRTFNCRGVRLPTWLDEGLSRYSENNIDPNEIAQVEAALMDGRLPPLRSLASGFSAYGSSASLSYTQSYQAVQYLIETYGPEQMTELLVTMQAGSRIDVALLQVYGFDTAGVDASWRETTGYAATPTSEADSLAAQATPTMVPTLALAAPVVPATATATPTGTPLAAATLPATAVATITETASPTAMSTATPLPPETEGAVLESVPTPTLASTAVGSASPTWLLAGGAMLLALVIAFVIFIQRRGK